MRKIIIILSVIVGYFSNHDTAMTKGLDLYYGPFTLNGFYQKEFALHSTNIADNSKVRSWEDWRYKPSPDGKQITEDHRGFREGVELFQLSLGFEFELDQWEITEDAKLLARLTRRWRDGDPDLQDWDWYERYVGVAHERFGTIYVGNLITRSWQRSDYPFGSDNGLADPWGASGAGFGFVNNALRYTAPHIGTSMGNLVLEGMVSLPEKSARGFQGINRNQVLKPHDPYLVEFFGQLANPKLVFEYTFQMSQGAEQNAWAKQPFRGGFPNVNEGDPNPKQTIHQINADYRLTGDTNITLGARYNRWSGKSFECDYDTALPGCWYADWGFNVNDRNVGEPVWNVDFLAGVRHKIGPYTLGLGAMHFGRGNTKNTRENGQSNSANLISFGVSRVLNDIDDTLTGLEMSIGVGHMRYNKKSIGPVSMPGNGTYAANDPRVDKNSTSIGIGFKYAF